MSNGQHTPESAAATPARAPLDAARLTARLRTVGYADVDVVRVTGSTNSDLCNRTEAPNGTVLIAEEQSQGRGRLNRAWSAPAFSQVIVSASFLLPGVPSNRLGLVSLLAGVSIAEGLRKSAGVEATLKWPNDVLVDARKLVGILVEAPHVGDVSRVVVGFGVNYDLTTSELPVPHATSVALDTTRSQAVGVNSEEPAPELASREDIIVAILLRLQEDMERFRAMGGAPQTFLSRYKKFSATLGTTVKVMLPGDSVMEGTAVDIAEDGQLIVDTGGSRTSVSAGDVVHLRPGGATSDNHYADSPENSANTNDTQGEAGRG